MNTKLENLEKTVSSILKRHGFDVHTEVDGSFTIQKQGNGIINQANLFNYGTIIILLIAIVVMYFNGEFKMKAYFFIGSILIAVVANLIKRKEIHYNLSDQIKVNKGNITIHKKTEINSFTSESIDEFEITYPVDDKMMIGRILLKRKSKQDVQILEVISEEKKYLEDDMLKIVEYLQLKLEM